MIGQAPPVLERLNEVERTLISRARVNKHVFSYEAGCHKSIKGWHTMFYNEVEAVLGISNWSESLARVDDNSEDNENSEDIPSIGWGKDVEWKKILPEICVILTGPFTSIQKAKVLQRTRINWSYVKEALLWLQSHNRLYRDVDIEAYVNVMPQVVDESEIVMSENNNIEEVYEIFAVFHDSNIPCRSNGGCGNSRELKQLTVECLLSRNNCKDATLISKPTTNVLRDYQGDNLLLAYPIQFPYGIGSRDAAGLERVGTEYLKYLCSLSHPNFHQSNWVCVLYNMFERRRMITASYLKTSEEERQMFCDISSEDIGAALVRYKEKEFGNGAADIFLNKMRAVTGSMAHSAQGARIARQKMFAMVTSLGLPCVFFTISPEDGVNFRIRVLSKGGKGSECPPGLGLDEEIYRHFLMEGERIRIDNPGLCAIDFENVIDIVVEYILGWDTRNKCNKPDYGCFGDLDGWTYAVEEQGRKTLHAHFCYGLRVGMIL
ncbi:helitron helicase-like protein [Nitzschia inconspicua]|uniref:Helitron helicase-like protein n=1 Tax=Nitzschia inconspicua TaxID=303405 RepID=A0A9K3L1K4_9STRA|nr:helitron helicase-like protein [Nitzschia inconspicua]